MFFIQRMNGIAMLMSEHQKLKTDSDYFIDDGHSTVRREKQRTSYPSEDFVAGICNKVSLYIILQLTAHFVLVCLGEQL